MAEMDAVQQESAPHDVAPVAKLAYAAGAVISVALVIGMGVWGYKLLVRDVSGVPVIRAAEGPMRVQPDDPGGQRAEHQGLSVNEVAADGAVSEPADRLILAPEPLDLGTEVPPDPGAGTTAEIRVAAEIDTAGQATAGAPEDAPETGEAPDERADRGQDADQQAASPPTPGAEEDDPETVTGGLGRSLRPKSRPAGLENVRSVSAAAVQAPREIDPADIPEGTRLAQLGAFSSAEIAREEWARLAGRFDEYLSSKDRVIQRAESGGRIFYRLRAMGFDDLGDARRFCSALVAENAECIPVVAR